MRKQEDGFVLHVRRKKGNFEFFHFIYTFFNGRKGGRVKKGDRKERKIMRRKDKMNIDKE